MDGESSLSEHGPAKVLVQAAQAPDRAPKWRSGEAAKDQHQRPSAPSGEQVHLRAAVERALPDIGCAIAGALRAFAPRVMAQDTEDIAQSDVGDRGQNKTQRQQSTGEKSPLSRLAHRRRVSGMRAD